MFGCEELVREYQAGMVCYSLVHQPKVFLLAPDWPFLKEYGLI